MELWRADLAKVLYDAITLHIVVACSCVILPSWGSSASVSELWGIFQAQRLGTQVNPLLRFCCTLLQYLSPSQIHSQVLFFLRARWRLDSSARDEKCCTDSDSRQALKLTSPFSSRRSLWFPKLTNHFHCVSGQVECWIWKDPPNTGCFVRRLAVIYYWDLLPVCSPCFTGGCFVLRGESWFLWVFAGMARPNKNSCNLKTANKWLCLLMCGVK